MQLLLAGKSSDIAVYYLHTVDDCRILFLQKIALS